MEMLLVYLYVDDIIHMGTQAKLVENFKRKMMNQFEITDLGLLHYFLSLEITQNTTCITITLKKYTNDLLQKFGLGNCKHSTTTANANKKLQQSNGTGDADGQRYRSMVGGLLYLAHTHPDLIYIVSLVSRSLSRPTVQHQGAVK